MLATTGSFYGSRASPNKRVAKSPTSRGSALTATILAAPTVSPLYSAKKLVNAFSFIGASTW
jgi:hypothetical protein